MAQFRTLTARVQQILTENGAVIGVQTQTEKIFADWVILATGGASYPATGSTGDGYAMALRCGLPLMGMEFVQM